MEPTEFLIKLISSIDTKVFYIDVDVILFKAEEKTIFGQDLKNKILWVDYYEIWLVLEKRYHEQKTEIQELISNTIEEHLEIKGFTPEYSSRLRTAPLWLG